MSNIQLDRSVYRSSMKSLHVEIDTYNITSNNSEKYFGDAVTLS